MGTSFKLALFKNLDISQGVLVGKLVPELNHSITTVNRDITELNHSLTIQQEQLSLTDYLDEVREFVEVVEGCGGGGVDPQRLQLSKVAVAVRRSPVALLLAGSSSRDGGGSGLERPGEVQGLGPR